MRYRGNTRDIGDKAITNGELYHVDIVKRLFKVNPAPLTLRCRRSGKGNTVVIDYRSFDEAVRDWELA